MHLELPSTYYTAAAGSVFDLQLRQLCMPRELFESVKSRGLRMPIEEYQLAAPAREFCGVHHGQAQPGRTAFSMARQLKITDGPPLSCG